jgi:hypothetical protein
MQDGKLDKAVWGAIPEELLEHNLDTYPFMTSLLPPSASTGNHLIVAHCSCKPIQIIPHLDLNCYNINMSENGGFTGQVTANPQMNGRNLPLLSLPCLAWKKV